MIIDDILDKGLNDIHFGNIYDVLNNFEFWYCYRLNWLRHHRDEKSDNKYYDESVNRILRYATNIIVDRTKIFLNDESYDVMCDYIIEVNESHRKDSLHGKSVIRECLEIGFDYRGLISFKGKFGSSEIAFEFLTFKPYLERFKLLNM